MLFRKSLSAAGALPLLAVGLTATLLLAADNRPAEPTRPSVPAQPTGAAPLSASLADTHVLLDIKGEDRPVFSPDGKWLAVREGKEQLVLVDVVQALKDPKAVKPFRCESVPLLNKTPNPMGNPDSVGEIAAFSADSKQMLFRGKQGLLVLALPPAGAPEAVTDGDGDKAPFLPSLSAGVWPVLKINESQAKVLEFLRHPAQKIAAKVIPPILSGSVRWADDGSTLLAAFEAGDCARIGLDGTCTPIITKTAVEKTLGKPLAVVKALAVTAGKYLIEGARPYPKEMGGMKGTYVPSGDETPERGRNPGSAEPGPDMPRYVCLLEENKLNLVQKISLARWLDTLLVLPSGKLDRFITFQIANEGPAGHGVPHAWLGRIDVTGKKTEKDLGNPFPQTVDAPRFSALDTAPDASKALVFMRANRDKVIPVKVDDEVEKALKQMGNQAVHRDDPMRPRRCSRGCCKSPSTAALAEARDRTACTLASPPGHCGCWTRRSRKSGNLGRSSAKRLVSWRE